MLPGWGYSNGCSVDCILQQPGAVTIADSDETTYADGSTHTAAVTIADSDETTHAGGITHTAAFAGAITKAVAQSDSDSCCEHSAGDTSYAGRAR